MQVSKSKRRITLMILVLVLSACTTNNQTNNDRGKIIIKALSDIDQAIQLMTLEEKAGQLIQAERSKISFSDITRYNIGSILSGGGSVPQGNTPEAWVSMINQMNVAALSLLLGFPSSMASMRFMATAMSRMRQFFLTTLDLVPPMILN
jgi:beta-glucosidase